MKRWMIIVLLLLFAYIQGGYFIHSGVLRSAARQQFKRSLIANLPDSSLDQFCLEDIANNIHWEEKGKEFWLQGQLYDVVKHHEAGGKRYVSCIRDEKEKEIVETHTKLTRNNSNNGPDRSKSYKYTFPDFIVNSAFTVKAYVGQAAITYPAIEEKTTHRCFDIVSPPPQS
jgi:hypothetical protein